MVEDRNVLRLPDLLDHKGGDQSSRSISTSVEDATMVMPPLETKG